MGKKKDRNKSKKKSEKSDSESKSQYGTPIQRSESMSANPMAPTWEQPATFETPGKMDRMPGEIENAPKRDYDKIRAEQNIQRALRGTGTSQDEVPEQVLDVIGSGGMPLRPAIQRSLEDRMDASFSDVRIHTGSKAAEAADAIDAKAFTCGNNIVFNQGEYDLDSPEGQHLLAHELAHVKQQNGGAPLSMMPKEDADLEIDPDPMLEREADQAAQEALSEGPVTISRMGTDVHVQRLPWDQSNLNAFDEDGYDLEADQGLEHPVKNQPARFGSAARKDYRKTFFDAYPHLKGEVFVHHAVEQQVQEDYGIISDSEIHSLENLRGIPKDKNTELHLSTIRREWDRFYRNNPETTKEGLLEKATEIDNKYGHLFSPPVR